MFLCPRPFTPRQSCDTPLTSHTISEFLYVPCLTYHLIVATCPRPHIPLQVLCLRPHGAVNNCCMIQVPYTTSELHYVSCPIYHLSCTMFQISYTISVALSQASYATSITLCLKPHIPLQTCTTSQTSNTTSELLYVLDLM